MWGARNSAVGCLLGLRARHPHTPLTIFHPRSHNLNFLPDLRFHLKNLASVIPQDHYLAGPTPCDSTSATDCKGPPLSALHVQIAVTMDPANVIPAKRKPTPSDSDNTDTGSSMAPSRCRKRIPSEEWEKKRPIIARLYQEEKKSLKEVMEILERDYQFTATCVQPFSAHLTHDQLSA